MGKTILFCGGGTLGHIYPALSFIHYLKEKNPEYRIIFFATLKDKKYDALINNKDIEKIYWFDVYGIPKNVLKIPGIFIKNLKSYHSIKKTIVKENIDITIGMGGYISGISILASSKLNIKTIIHEQNSVIGLANKLVLKDVDLILTSFKDTKISNKYLKKIKWIGNPRYDIIKTNSPSIYKNKSQILITSGSLGSKLINDKAIEFLNSEESKKYTTTLITGKKYYNDVVERIHKGHHYQIQAFSNNMIGEMNKAMYVISRAGSTTLFEILATKSISLVIPSNNVTKNHQYLNAKSFYDEGLIELVTEDQLSKESLLMYISKLEKQKPKISNNIERYNLGDVCYSFYEEMKKLLK